MNSFTKKRSADDSADGGAPVYQKIKSGRTIGYPITVTQGVAQHDAILLDCNDENPEEYLAKFANDDRVKIRWSDAGWTDFIAVGSIALKEIDAAPPVREAAVNSGLLVQTSDGDGENMMSREGDDGDASQPVTSNVTIKTDDIHTDDEATIQDKELMTQQVMSNLAVKTHEIDTDDEATHQDKDLPTPQPVASNMVIKTDHIDTDTDDEIDTQQQGKAASALNLTMNVSAPTSDEEDVVVLKFFEKINSCKEGEPEDGYDEIWEMIKANHYLVNATCPQTMENIEVGYTAMEALCCVSPTADTRDLLYELVCLGGKGTDKCYERIMDEFEMDSTFRVLYVFDFLEVLLLSGYWPTEKSDFLLDALVEDIEEEGEEADAVRVLRIFYKDISVGEDGFFCGDANSTIINNINGLPPLVVGETHSEGGPMEKLMNRFPCERVICSTCNASKLAWRFSSEHKCCYDCERRDFLICYTCRVSKRRLDHFTADQREEEYWARCIECVKTQNDRI